jgi:tripartite-type tricarboxylate transporter receptor subunit TctC
MLVDRRRLILCVSGFAGQGLAAAAFAQNWSSRTVVIIVPSRLLAEKLKAVLAQPVVVENKPGAGGNLAASEAARAEPDGDRQAGSKGFAIDYPISVTVPILPGDVIKIPERYF